MRLERLPPHPDLGQYRPPTCKLCGSVGTIVELGACCLIAEFIALGGLWEQWREPYQAPRERAKRRK